jgi:N-acetylated-alpha-linked acidic dipeptidase
MERHQAEGSCRAWCGWLSHLLRSGAMTDMRWEMFFPAGPMRPSQGVQRGSVADMPTYPGDPLTPGVGATKNAKRLTVRRSENADKDSDVFRFPTATRRPLLAALRGSVVSVFVAWWPSPSLTGLAPARRKCTCASSRTGASRRYRQRDCKNAGDHRRQISGSFRGNQSRCMGQRCRGSYLPDSLRSWKRRAHLGVLKSQGWKPKRTIIYAAWDGEEPGLLGSTEWVETHGDELRDHAVAYINSDTNAEATWAYPVRILSRNSSTASGATSWILRQSCPPTRE